MSSESSLYNYLSSSQTGKSLEQMANTLEKALVKSNITQSTKSISMFGNLVKYLSHSLKVCCLVFSSVMYQNRLSLPYQPEAWSHFGNSVLGMSGLSKNYHWSRHSDTWLRQTWPTPATVVHSRTWRKKEGLWLWLFIAILLSNLRKYACFE